MGIQPILLNPDVKKKKYLGQGKVSLLLPGTGGSCLGWRGGRIGNNLVSARALLLWMWPKRTQEFLSLKLCKAVPKVRMSHPAD